MSTIQKKVPLFSMSSDRVSCILRNATEWKSEANPQELALPFNREGLRLELRLSDPLSHLTCPPNFLQTTSVLNVPFCHHP